MKKIYTFLIGLSILSMSLAGCGRGGGGAEPGGGDGGDSTDPYVEPPTHEHTWADPTYTWSDDYSSCMAERVCTHDSTHKESETANSTYLVVTESSCEVDGLGRYTASFENSAFLTQTHDTIIEAFGHIYQFDSFVWTDYTAQVKYVCSRDSSHIEYYDAIVTSKVTTSPTCENSGIKTYTATYDGHSDTKTEVLSALGHNWGTPTYTWSNDYSSCTVERVCLNDSTHKNTETVNSTYAVVTEPTEESEGLGRYTATFTKTAFTTQTHDVILYKYYYGQAPILSEDGKTLTYGLYPQKNVNDSTLISALNALTTPKSNGWYLYNNDYYAKVSAKPSYSCYEFDNGTQIVEGTTYWFKCEPITWNVLSNNSGEYYILSSILLDAHCYYNSKDERTIDGKTIYPNNYEYSDIRNWLNNDFYNSAFALGNSYIQTTTVDNSASTTNSSSNKYACNNTQDKVFLPSYQDYINSSYGFSTETSATDTRYCRTTDWTRARGASSDPFYSWYFTRSPSRVYNDVVFIVSNDGIFSTTDVDGTRISVRPGLSISIT